MIVILVYRDPKNIQNGFTIRVKGYTKYLKSFGVNYKFLAPARPDYVDKKDFVPFKLDNKILILIKIYNLIYFLPIIPKIIGNIVLKDKNIRNLVKISKDRYILSHQNSSTSLFLKLACNQKFIHDVHGIQRLQKEFFKDYNLKEKILFITDIWIERLVMKKADIVNVNSFKMKEYVKKGFKRTNGVIVARDGLLRDNFDLLVSEKEISKLRDKYGLKKKDKILYFAGTFKKIGGVHHLVDVFCDLSKEFDNLKLLLIGKRQMEEYVSKKIKKFHLNKRFIHLRSVDYDEIFKFQQLSTLIICPDIVNKYNEITPHIKLFDALSSKKPVLSSRFEVLTEMFPESRNCILYFEPSNLEDMKKKIIEVFDSKIKFRPLTNKELSRLTYKRASEDVISQYKKIGIV